MEVKLVVVGGATAQASEFAIKLPTVIGRSRTADLPLANPLVSRRHCEIFEANGQLMVRDLGSLNGTFVGKTRVTDEAAVAPGSVLTIGAIVLRADYVGANGANGAAAPAAVEKPAATPDSDESTVSVDELETLEPMGEGADDADFNLAWLEEGSAGDSPEAGGAPAGQAASAKQTVSSKDAAKKGAPAKAAAPAAGAKAGQDKQAPASQSDSLDDLSDLVG
jgi:predicted component of type VI protein secretion system